MKKSNFFRLGVAALALILVMTAIGCGKKDAASVAGAAASAVEAVETVAGAADAVKAATTGATGGTEAPASDFTYDLTADGAGILITGYTGSGGALVIPSTIEDMPVTEIGDRVFSGAAGNDPIRKTDAITSIVVPDSVTIIGSGAFGYIDELTKATLPDGLKVIPGDLFCGCEKLTSVNLPSSLESIGGSAFMACVELNNLTIPASLTSVKWLFVLGTETPDNYAFAGCGKLPIKTRQTIQSWGYTSGF